MGVHLLAGNLLALADYWPHRQSKVDRVQIKKSSQSENNTVNLWFIRKSFWDLLSKTDYILIFLLRSSVTIPAATHAVFIQT